jgi:transcriptional regulator with XRE-family HTH domain
MTVPPMDRRPNAALRAARRRLEMSQDDLVRALREAGWPSCDRRTVQRYESGTITCPQYPARRALAAVFRMPLSELGFPPPDYEDKDDVDRRQLLTLTTAKLINGIGEEQTHAGGNETPTRPEAHPIPGADEVVEPEKAEPDQDLDRRGLLQALATLGVASSPVLQALRHIQGSVEDVLGQNDDVHLADWEEIVAEYGYSYVSRPPHLLLPDVAADLVTVRTIMSRNQKQDLRHADWCRVASGLSMIMAKTLANLGQSREARTWWVTAQHAADASGDTDLGLWVSAERLVHGLYEKRPASILLRQANTVARGTADTAGRGLAEIRAVRAQLLALAGQGAEAVNELDRGRDVFARLPGSVTDREGSIACWGEDRLHYTETWVAAHLGDLHRLDQAVARAHEVLPSADTRAHAQINLLQSFGHIRTGDAAEGIRAAGAVYDAHPVDQRTTMVRSLADLVLEAVPAQRRDDPAVVSYRQLLASGGQHKAIT